MTKKEGFNPSLNRVIDANLNRLKEGIRVIEDIYRYIFNNSEIGYKLKDVRHLIRIDNYKEFLHYRDALNDVLKSDTDSEYKRDSLESIIIANFKRTQESSRVLEEIYKLIDIESAKKFKSIRYKLYNIEIDAIKFLENREDN